MCAASCPTTCPTTRSRATARRSSSGTTSITSRPRRSSSIRRPPCAWDWCSGRCAPTRRSTTCSSRSSSSWTPCRITRAISCSSPSISTRRSWPGSTIWARRSRSADWRSTPRRSATASSSWPSATISTSSRAACPTSSPTAGFTTWGSSAAATARTTCTRRSTSRPTR